MNLNASVFGALNPFLKGQEGWGEDALGWLVSGATAAGAIAAAVLGPVTDRVGRRPMVLWGLLVFSVASVAHGFESLGYGGLLLCRIVSGAAVGIAYSSATAALADAVPYATRGRAMGLMTAGMMLAVPLGMPVAVWLAQDGQWRTIFLIQGVLGALAALAVGLVLPGKSGVAGSGERGFRRIRSALGRPGVLPGLVAAGLNIGAFYTVIQFLGVWLNDSGVLPKGDQGALWIGLGVTAVIGSGLLGRFGDRFGNKRFVIVTTLTKAAILLALPLAGGEALADGVPPEGDLTLFLALAIPLALVASARTGPLGALISELVPDHERGTVMGLRSAFQMAGMALTAGVFGAVMKAGGFAAGTLVAAAMMAVSCVLLGLGVRRLR